MKGIRRAHQKRLDIARKLMQKALKVDFGPLNFYRPDPDDTETLELIATVTTGFCPIDNGISEPLNVELVQPENLSQDLIDEAHIVGVKGNLYEISARDRTLAGFVYLWLFSLTPIGQPEP